MLILAAVAAFFCKNAVVDTTAMLTGKTPPSHSYRMAELRAKNRRYEDDPDHRGGLKMVARHWYLDACEDLDHWRANRHATRPERKAAARARREERLRRIREWAEQYLPDDVEDGDEDDFEPRRTPDPEPQPEPEPERPRGRRRRKRTTTTEEEVEEVEVIELSDDTTLVPFGYQDQEERPPLPHRRMVLATMIADAGHEPDWEVIAQMDSDQVDQAISGLIVLRRGERTA